MNDSSVQNSRTYRVVCWGTYDTGKPRVRLLIEGMKKCGFEVLECHADVWSNVRDKSQIKGFFRIAVFAFKIVLSYPRLIFRYLKLPRHDLVLIPYMGVLDLLIISPCAKWRKIPLFWDIFIPLYDTIVNDRAILSEGSLISRLIYSIERHAALTTDRNFLDTKTHADYFSELYRIDRKKIDAVFVGAEAVFFKRNVLPPAPLDLSKFNVLFYGQFIPLQGIGTIVKAANIIKEKREYDIHFTLIGEGQESKNIDHIIAQDNIDNITIYSWIDYEELVSWIHSADICLGIFGRSEKAQRVIPNKIFQVIAVNKTIISADTYAMKELNEYRKIPFLYLIPPDDPEALAEKIIELRRNITMGKEKISTGLYGIGAYEVGCQFRMMVEKYFTKVDI